MLRKEGNRLIREFGGEMVCIEAWGTDSLRVRAVINSEFESENSALTEFFADSKVEIDIDGQNGTIKNGKITAKITNAGGRIAFYNDKGECLLEEYARNFENPSIPPSPLKYYPREWKPISGGDYRLTVHFESNPSEKVFGMGQYPQENLDLKGCVLELAHRNTQSSVPFFVSSLGYGFLWNNPAIGKVMFGKNRTEWQLRSTVQMDYWITAGDSPAEIMESYTAVTGRPPMMPDYAMGFWQSRLRYQTQEELLEVAREYKRRGIPLDVIVLDFGHWVHQGDWTFDKEFFPKPEEMVRELREMNVELMVSVWPTVATDSENFEKMNEEGLLVRAERGNRITMQFYGDTRFIDVTNPKTREFLWEKLKKTYYDIGISLFWLDEAEPEYMEYDYENYRYYTGTVLKTGNLYPVYYSKAIYDGIKMSGKDENIHLVRCAWAGSQRYGALVWSGDVCANFKALREQLVEGLSMGLAGIPWWTCDIGGFIGGNPDDAKYRELVIRWFQFAAFCPVFRLHGDRRPKMEPVAERVLYSGAPNEVWSYGEEAYEIFKKYIFLRERMRPYIKGLMKEAHEKGTPVMRALFYEFHGDERCWNVNDQFMFGADIMVCPAMDEGQRSRSVYLPSGAEWKNAHSKEVYTGGQFITVEAPLDTICVMLRDGRQAEFFEEYKREG